MLMTVIDPVLMNISFQVGRLEVEEAVFRKLKMENFMDIPEGCKVEFP